MYTRRAVLTSVVGCLLTSRMCFGDQKKRKKDRSGPVGAQDGKDDVKGAVWQINATLGENKKKEQFKFRVQDGVIFDPKGTKAGVVSSLGESKEGGVKSRIVFRETFPLKGEMVITQTKKGVWHGVLKTKEGEEWNCRLEVLDR